MVCTHRALCEVWAPPSVKPPDCSLPSCLGFAECSLQASPRAQQELKGPTREGWGSFSESCLFFWNPLSCQLPEPLPPPPSQQGCHTLLSASFPTFMSDIKYCNSFLLVTPCVFSLCLFWLFQGCFSLHVSFIACEALDCICLIPFDGLCLLRGELSAFPLLWLLMILELVHQIISCSLFARLCLFHYSSLLILTGLITIISFIFSPSIGLEVYFLS